MAYDKAIQMFIFEGNPNGRIMCELSNWNGIVNIISRNEINKFSERKESNYTGILSASLFVFLVQGCFHNGSLVAGEVIILLLLSLILVSEKLKCRSL